MEKETNPSQESEIEERIADVREGVTDADATGLIAGEQLITQAETLLPVTPPAQFPAEDLHNALPKDHAAHGTIDALDAELSAGSPNPAAIRQHVESLRGLPQLRDSVVAWWEQPWVQRLVSELGQIGV